MKNILYICLLVVLSQCDIIDKFTQFNIDHQTEFTVGSSTVINTPIDINTPDITTNSSSEFSNNDTRADLIESIKLTSLKLSINSPTDGNFNFLKSVTIYIDADGLDEIEIASITDIPDDDMDTLDLITSGSDLKAYIKKDSYTLRVETVTDQLISEDHVIKADSRFRVDAKILGV
ncbi:MAG: hypothetical protein ACPG45_10095 [Flavobacteriaceae bacterium]